MGIAETCWMCPLCLVKMPEPGEAARIAAQSCGASGGAQLARPRVQRTEGCAAAQGGEVAGIQ